MKEITAAIFVIMGAMMSGFSFYLDYSNKNSKMMLFLLAGFVFIVIGLVNLIFRQQRKTAQSLKVNHILRTQNIQPRNVFSKYCSHCGTMLRHMDQYCYRCGSKFFHRK